jgi:predicted DNA-binding helix-hairpin-helix protein
MEQIVRVARSLREDHSFRGYIHLKTIPEADPVLIAEAGRHADRVSINVELPTESALTKLAPEKRASSIKKTMAATRLRIDEAEAEKKAPRFAPAGQSTQMIVGADGAPDTIIISTSATLYANYNLKRIYYSAFSPIPDASHTLPAQAAPLARENRLYQADWLFRFYGFSTQEITEGLPGGMLDLDIDPKLAWALRNRGRFPIDVNKASRDELLRIPGLGTKTVDRMIMTRRHRTLRLDDVARLAGSVRRTRPFIVTPDHQPARQLDQANLRAMLAPKPQQLSLFG